MNRQALATELDWGTDEVGSGGVLRVPSHDQPKAVHEGSTSPWLPVVTVAIVFGLSAGTGGIRHADALAGKAFRIEPVQVPEVRETENQQDIGTRHVLDQLSNIQDTFGLNISELAATLHVQRPTIYQWQKGVRLRAKNARRLGELHSIATAVHRMDLSDAERILHMTRDGSPSLFSLLRSGDLNEETILAAMTWGTDVRNRQQTVRSRLAAAAKQHGFEEVPREEQQRNLEQNSSEIS